MRNCNTHVSVDAHFALGYLHHAMEMGSVDDISEKHVASAFRVRVG
jgi:hypothetical protein